MQWPEITKECRPWTYWWWLGSAVDEGELTRHLTAYREAGMGGVHIVPIYGAKGFEDKNIDYLTPEWMRMLNHTVREGERLDIGIDMTAGTGWPYGGPWGRPRTGGGNGIIRHIRAPGGRVDRPADSR